MDKPTLPRRRLLTYLGLGSLGVGAAVLGSAVALPRLQSPKPQSSQSSAKSPRLEGAPALAATLHNSLPEFQEITDWLNSSPLTAADLKGSVVLIQFWTFACINCQRTLPSVVQWHQTYASQGLKVIGVHTPEFAYEREIDNVKQAIEEHGITYPVPLDNGFKTWSAYNNEYWPHLFLADRQSIIQYDHIGEGAYDETEEKIKQLLG
jgi:thiol-disulfide isomerase/thioredoxin